MAVSSDTGQTNQGAKACRFLSAMCQLHDFGHLRNLLRTAVSLYVSGSKSLLPKVVRRVHEVTCPSHGTGPDTYYLPVMGSCGHHGWQ